VAQGGEVEVTITAAGYGSLGAVTETLPVGFSYVSSSLTEEGEVTEVDDRTVRFTLQGADKSFTYTVTASSTAGTYDFSGMLRDADRADHDVGGAASVTVEAAAGAASASRSFSPASVAPDGEVEVTITAAGYGSLGAVTETLPAGFSYESSSLTGEGEVDEVDAQTVRFILQGADNRVQLRIQQSHRRG
jgi:predicted pyridoxine 5'-phosphate oxidase superfamily flavin-nucleotide-binding protein